MEAAFFQIGKELGELRGRVEALERTAGAHSEARSASERVSEYPGGATNPELAPSERTLAPAEINHRVPNVPLVLDGEALEDPQEITKANGKPLYYTPLRTRVGIALAAFTDPRAMISESSKLVRTMTEGSIAAATSEHICQQPPDNLPERVQFFEDINESGDTIGLDPDRAYPDLTEERVESRGDEGRPGDPDYEQREAREESSEQREYATHLFYLPSMIFCWPQRVGQAGA